MITVSIVVFISKCILSQSGAGGKVSFRIAFSTLTFYCNDVKIDNPSKKQGLYFCCYLNEKRMGYMAKHKKIEKKKELDRRRIRRRKRLKLKAKGLLKNNKE
jgi:hypothetical protein